MNAITLIVSEIAMVTQSLMSIATNPTIYAVCVTANVAGWMVPTPWTLVMTLTVVYVYGKEGT